MKDLALHIMDIVQNSVTAGATQIGIAVSHDTGANTLLITVSDNGCGMTEEVLARATDPYYTSRTTRKVGMGIPLLMQSAEQAGGWLKLDSEPGKGTTLTAMFVHDHLDRPALGDMAGVISLLISANEGIRFLYKHSMDDCEYMLDTKEINEALDGMSVADAGVIRFIREMIRENLASIQAI